MMISSAAANTVNGAGRTCFVYGTLMSPDVLQVLLGRIPRVIPGAVLLHHSRHPVLGRVYPGVIATPPSISGSPARASVEGLVLLDITPLEMRILDWFESDEYKRSDVEVMIPKEFLNSVPDSPPMNINDKEYPNSSEESLFKTNTYIWAAGAEHLDTSCDWDYNEFLQNHIGWFLENTVGPCRSQVEKEMITLSVVANDESQKK